MTNLAPQIHNLCFALDVAIQELMFSAADEATIGVLSTARREALEQLHAASGARPPAKLPTAEELDQLRADYPALTPEDLQGLVFTVLERWGCNR